MLIRNLSINLFVRPVPRLALVIVQRSAECRVLRRYDWYMVEVEGRTCMITMSREKALEYFEKCEAR